jgi:hypothetical protein
MVRYFYAWMPLFFIGTLVLLALPWLGLIALMLVALVALPAIGWAIVWMALMVVRGIGRLWQHGRSVATPRTAAALAPARSQHA